MYFVDFLDNCEGTCVTIDIILLGILLIEELIDVSLETVLSFFTSADRILPSGMEVGRLEFLKSGVLATAATSGNILRLPIANDYNAFKDALILSFKGHDGYGVV